MQQLLTGKVVERFDYDSFEAVSIEIPNIERRHSPYHYRILFFPTEVESRDKRKPVLSLNLESSILGSYCLTEHNGRDHINLGSIDDAMGYEEFRNWALRKAKQDLH